MASFSYSRARGSIVQLSLVWFDFQWKTTQKLRQSASRSRSHFNLHSPCFEPYWLASAIVGSCLPLSRISRQGNHRFCGDLTAAVASRPFPRVQPKQKPLVDQPLWWPDSHRCVRVDNIVTEVFNFNIYGYYMSTNRGSVVVYCANGVCIAS